VALADFIVVAVGAAAGVVSAIPAVIQWLRRR
jgi:hypothetical protein